MDKLIEFLEKKYNKDGEKTQTFYTRNWTEDPMEEVYNDGRISVEYSDIYEYLEIFGLTDEEKRELKNKGWHS